MTNTKFRKRALLSSVAMLLVAMLALGSATFAWYEANIKVSATGMSFQTTAASGLLIASESDILTAVNTAGLAAAADPDEYVPVTTVTDAMLTAYENWGSSANLASNHNVLQPLSLCAADGVNKGKFFSVAASGPDSVDPVAHADAVGTPGDDDYVAAVTGSAVTEYTGTTDYVQETVYFRLDDGSTESANVALNTIGMTVATSMGNAARVALFTTAGALLAEFAPNQVTETGLIAEGEYGTSGVSASKTIAACSTADTQVLTNIGQTPALTQAVIVRVYLDGFGTNVKTNVAKTILTQDILSSLTLNFIAS